MPSDGSLIQAVLEAMREPAEAFHSALARAAEELRSFIDRHGDRRADPASLVAAELGTFGEGRVDATRFAALIAPGKTIGSEGLHHVERALETLMAAEAEGVDFLSVSVPRDGSLQEAVAGGLARIGRVFGTLRRVAPLLDGRGDQAWADDLPYEYPFESWTRAERAAAPPVFVELDGSDLNVAGLSAFLDGAQKIVLVVSGTAPPAPLAQLISPGMFVMQTSDPTDLVRVRDIAGPAVVAIGEGGLVRFVHDPAAGSHYARRLSVGDLPEADARRLLGFRQREDLEHLRELAATPATAPPAAGAETITSGPPEADPVDRLASWLLQQAKFVDGAEIG